MDKYLDYRYILEIFSRKEMFYKITIFVFDIHKIYIHD